MQLQTNENFDFVPVAKYAYNSDIYTSREFEEKNMRVAIFGRVSSNKVSQDTSVETQHDMLTNYSLLRGWSIVESYEERVSGTLTENKRKVLSRMITDLEAGKFDVIVVKEISRLGRDGELLYRLKKTLENNNVHLITLDGKVNTLEGNSQYFGLYVWMAESEAVTISQRVRTSLRTVAQAGKFTGSNPPYGYKVENQRLILGDIEQVQTVKRIFKLYLDGKGFEAIARILMREKTPTPAQIAKKKNAGQTWHGSAVACILTNPHYTGDLVQNRTTTISVSNKTRIHCPKENMIIVPNCHEAIISKTDFELVQSLIENKRKNKAKVRGSIHLFTEVSFCGCCGKGMVYKSNSKGYVCSSYNKFGTDSCTSHLVREKDLKKQIQFDLKEQVANLKDKKYLQKIRRKLKKQSNESIKLFEQLQNKLSNLEFKKENLINKVAEGKIEAELLNDFLSKTNLEIEELKAKIKKIQAHPTVNEEIEKKMKVAESIINELLTFNEITPEVINRFIEKIIIDKTGNPRIHYRFAD